MNITTDEIITITPCPEGIELGAEGEKVVEEILMEE